LNQRGNILATYGLRSRERTTIDEEFISQMKLIEADAKRMRSLLQSYEEQKKSDMKPEEKEEREFVIKMVKDALSLLKEEY